jgi:hypothetical protein
MIDCNLGRRRNGSWRRTRRGGNFFALRDGFQHVSGPGDVRQINFGLDFLFAANPTRRGFSRLRRTFARGADVDAYFFRFVLFQRAGVRFLLGHPNQR